MPDDGRSRHAEIGVAWPGEPFAVREPFEVEIQPPWQLTLAAVEGGDPPEHLSLGLAVPVDVAGVGEVA